MNFISIVIITYIKDIFWNTLFRSSLKKKSFLRLLKVNKRIFIFQYCLVLSLFVEENFLDNLIYNFHSGFHDNEQESVLGTRGQPVGADIETDDQVFIFQTFTYRFINLEMKHLISHFEKL